MKNTSIRPVNLAVHALSNLLGVEISNVFIDSNYDDVIALAHHLSNIKVGAPVNTFLRIGNSDSRKHKPYADLLEQLIKKNRLGITFPAHSVIPELLRYRLLNHSISISPILESINFSRSKKSDLESWAYLESCLEFPKTRFSRLAGGIKPSVYVFDDYNNFSKDHFIFVVSLFLLINDKSNVQTSNDIASWVLSNLMRIRQGRSNELRPVMISQKIKKYYKSSSSSKAETLNDAIQGFCFCLNRLSLVFSIRADSIKFSGDETNYYELVKSILNFQQLDKSRNKIAAFIIDLEWLPSPEWIESQPENTVSEKRHEEEMGHIAICLLTQRYPEIPCFVLTGMWSIDVLQKSLAVGAKWCFQKPISHHLNTSDHPSEELNYFNLEQHLTEFAEQAYGVYSQIPDINQLNLRSTLARKIIEEKMTGASRKEKEEKLRKLVARCFTAETIDIIHILGSGKSTASATFFVRSTVERAEGATRFIKLGTWLEIYKEYTAYQQIIRPKLNNHIARIIQSPAVITEKSAGLLAEAINVSSLAGFPEDYTCVKSLQDILTASISEKDGHHVILRYLLETINYVLLPLQLPVTKKDCYLTEIAIPVYTGRLKPIREIQPDYRCPIDGDRNLLPLHADTWTETDRKNFYLQNWKLISIHAKPSPESEVEIIIEHPHSKAKCKLRGEYHDCQRRFGALWFKLGMLVALDIEIDSPDESYKILSAAVRKQCFPKVEDEQSSLISLITFWKRTGIKKCHIEDPFEIFKDGDELVKLSSLGQSSFGNIHGDLNLNNLIYPSEHQKVGFLIDFSEAELEGLSTFDCAWLETQIWTHYLLPSLVELSSYIQIVDLDKSSPAILCNLLYHALEAMNCNAYPDSYFRTQALQSCQNAPEPLLQTIANTLIITQKVRHHFTTKIFVPFKGTDVYYALSISFLKHAGYQIEPPHPAQASHWINVLSYLCSAYYLQEPYKQASTMTKEEQTV